MKKYKYIIIIAFLILCIFGGLSFLYKYQTRDFVYTKLEDGTLELTRYTGDDPVVNIPEKVWGRKVTRIGIACFVINRDPLNYQVYIPDTVTCIGDGAFERCQDLIITGGENVEEIRASAFRACSFAEPFKFSDKLKTIGGWAFAGARGIGPIKLNEQLEYIRSFAFYYAEIEDLEIPENVSHIGSSAFEGTKWFEDQTGYVIVGQNILIKFPEEETVVIPSGVRMISVSEFYGDEITKNIYIPNSVEIIENPIMSYALDTLKIYIPASVHTIESDEGEEFNKIIFGGLQNVVFIVEEGSYAEEYAKKISEKYKSEYQVVEKIEYSD